MLISEVFHSIQGEGRYVGRPSVVVRRSGGNRRCWSCDTPYTAWNPEWATRSLESLLEQGGGYECEHAVITGGEPMPAPEMIGVTRQLRAEGHVITIQ